MMHIRHVTFLFLVFILKEVVCKLKAADVQLSRTATVKGSLSYLDWNPRPVFVFKGIPYGKPPLGELRFRPPRSFGLWKGRRDALKYGDRCHQKRDYKYMSEDCLFLNIHSPNLNPTNKLAVIVNIHGGGLTKGSGNRGATALCLMNNVLFVTMNYRLGPLGFFTTGDDNAPGNVGLLDQQMAIRWVKRYISKFGGDPNRITIMGDSGGGVSVSTQVLSPTNAGLFQRVISNSGVATAPGRVNTRHDEVNKSSKVAAAVGCSQLTKSASMRCLRNVDPGRLTSHGASVEPLYPYVDGTFLTDLPFNAYNTGKFNRIEYLLGFNRDEGVYFFNGLTPNKNNIKSLITSYTKRFYPKNTKAIVDEIMSVYVRNKGLTTDADYAKAYSNFVGDLRYIGPTNDVARKHSVYNRVYMFFFNHRPAYSSYPAWVSATHSDQKSYIMEFPFSKPNGGFSSAGKSLSRHIMKYYTNFAKTGNPNGSGLPVWPRLTCTNGEYMQLVYGPKPGERYQPKRMELWTETIPRLDTHRLPNYKGFPWTCPRATGLL
ncbi:unnamed protein product [Owenia fusiformis]|uniref:Carboxylic ester hydrolase n=1 Tax=Owenia fusiformis TaxID=6347 RepID=A0A8J1XPT2_OWEFU|nr:unnamed protein product [Owenia fusiformis]